MSSLYEIKAELEALGEVIESAGEFADEAIAQAMSSLEGDMHKKVGNIICYIRELDALAVAAKDEARRIHAISVARTNKADGLRKYLLWALNNLLDGRYEDASNKLRVVTAGGKQAIKLLEVPIDDVPIEYRRIVDQIDTDKVRATLEKGEQLEFAVLQPRGQYIRGL
jgi:hypothetical protein